MDEDECSQVVSGYGCSPGLPATVNNECHNELDECYHETPHILQ